MSTMGIPLLLVLDILLGYEITARHILGGIMLLGMLIYIIYKGDFSMKGIKYVIAANLLSVLTITAFKYSTSYFGSTELVNFYSALFAGGLFVVIVGRTKGIKGILKICKPKYLAFASLYGIASVLNAAAYKYMISSMVIACKRFFAMMFGIISGKLYFQEKNLLKKISVASMIGMGVIVMNIGPLLSVAIGGSGTQSPQFHSSSDSKALVCLAPLPKNPLKKSKSIFDI